MAQKKTSVKTTPKASVERKIVSAKSGEEVASGAGHVAVATKKGNATGLRIGAVVFWLLGILFEVGAVLILNGTFSFSNPAKGSDNTMVFLIAALVIDLIFVVIGSQLWKKSNDIDPASEKNAIKFFLWNNMGLIVSIIAFLPIVILFLSNKDLDKKTKTIVSVVAIVGFLIAGASSIDYNPASQEDLAAAQQTAASMGDGTTYWTPFGKSYHFDPNCQTLLRSATVYSGTIDEAFAANRNDPCNFCADSAAVNTDALNEDPVEDVEDTEVSSVSASAA